MAEDERPDRRRVRMHAPAGLWPPEPVHREAAHLLGDLRRGGDERVVVVQIEPEHARRLRCAEPARVKDSERDRHLPEDVAGHPLADHAVHAVDAPEHLDPTLEQAEQRPLVTLVHGGLAGHERDVRHDRESQSRWAGSRSANTSTRPISSAVTMKMHHLCGRVQDFARLTRM